MWVFLSQLCGHSFSFSPTNLAPTRHYFCLIIVLENSFRPTLFELHKEQILKPETALTKEIKLYDLFQTVFSNKVFTCFRAYVALLGDGLSDAHHIITSLCCCRLTVSLATQENKIFLMILAFMPENSCWLSWVQVIIGFTINYWDTF